MSNSQGTGSSFPKVHRRAILMWTVGVISGLTSVFVPLVAGLAHLSSQSSQTSREVADATATASTTEDTTAVGTPETAVPETAAPDDVATPSLAVPTPFAPTITPAVKPPSENKPAFTDSAADPDDDPFKPIGKPAVAAPSAPTSVATTAANERPVDAPDVAGEAENPAAPAAKQPVVVRGAPGAVGRPSDDPRRNQQLPIWTFKSKPAMQAMFVNADIKSVTLRTLSGAALAVPLNDLDAPGRHLATLALIARARFGIASQNVQLARPSLTLAERLESNNARLDFTEGLCQALVEKNLIEAKKTFIKCLRKMPGHVPTLNNLGLLFVRSTGSSTEGFKHWSAALDAAPGTEEVLRNVRFAVQQAEAKRLTLSVIAKKFADDLVADGIAPELEAEGWWYMDMEPDEEYSWGGTDPADVNPNWLFEPVRAPADQRPRRVRP